MSQKVIGVYTEYSLVLHDKKNLSVQVLDSTCLNGEALEAFEAIAKNLNQAFILSAQDSQFEAKIHKEDKPSYDWHFEGVPAYETVLDARHDKTVPLEDILKLFR